MLVLGGMAARPAADADPLRDAGVAAPLRVEAVKAAAKKSGSSSVKALVEAMRACGTCPAARDLGRVLAEWDEAELQAAGTPEFLVEVARGKDPEPLRAAAVQAFNRVPAGKRPAGTQDLELVKVKVTCVPAQMRYDPKEFTVAGGRWVEIEMNNPDSLQHNLLVVMPGALAEIGLAGDKLGETAEGKARQFVPDSPKVLHVMGLIDPGGTGRLAFRAPEKVGTYPFVCTYPSHWRMMNGKMKVTAPEAGSAAPAAGSAAPAAGGTAPAGAAPGPGGAAPPSKSAAPA